MLKPPEYLIYESAFRGNILPVTSLCNVGCMFCSHRHNPPGIQIYKTGPRSLEEVAQTLQFISPEDKIVIGESVTRIVEGEPFTHPFIRQILLMIREHFPGTRIQITTNGTLLDAETARFLAGLGDVEIYLSLNSSNPAARRRLMNDSMAEQAVNSARCLADAGVSFHGSIVAMPHINGWEDLGETVFYLAECGTETIRVFLPGFTRYTPEHLKFKPGMHEELAEYIDSIRARAAVPVTVEPPVIKNLKAVVTGIISGTPADKAGLLRHDIILSVDGTRCFSRVHAFNRVRKGGPVKVEIQRNGHTFEAGIKIKQGQASGIVMDYDIAPETLAAVEAAAARHKCLKLLCSVLGEEVLRMALEKSPHRDVIDIVPVDNLFFGGSIAAAGLLTVSDFVEAAGNLRIESGRDVLIVPAIAFDVRGKDLTGRSYLELQEKFGTKVEIL